MSNGGTTATAPPPKSAAERGPRSFIHVISPTDGLVAVLFLLFAAVFQLAHLGHVEPYVLLDGDAGNIATFAAARDHPHLFDGDEILGNPALSRWYPTIHVPAVRALARVAGDYGLAFQSLLGLHVLLQCLGFYVFGRVLFRSRYWAFLLALVTLVRVDLNLGELWGIYEYPIPRISFQSLIPFVAAAAYHWRSNVRAWPAIMIGIGLLMYVHPVSTPAWALAFWLGFLAYVPSRWSWSRSFAVLPGLGVLFLAITAPFLIHYTSQQEVAPPASTQSYAQTYEIIEARFLPGYLDPPKAFIDFLLAFTTIKYKKFFWVWAVIGGLLTLAMKRDQHRDVLVILLWALGIVITSMILPVVDQGIARALSSFPLEYDLVRGMRYFVPLMLLFTLWPLSELSRRWHRTPARTGSIIASLLGALLVSVWIWWHPPVSVSGLVRCFRQGRLRCGPAREAEIEALSALERLVPPGSPILPTALALQVRYFSLRPVVYCHKDGGILAYTSHEGLLKWDGRRRAMSSAIALNDPRDRMRRLARLAVDFGAQYLLVDSAWVESTPSSHYEVVWMNRAYAIVRPTLAQPTR